MTEDHGYYRLDGSPGDLSDFAENEPVDTRPWFPVTITRELEVEFYIRADNEKDAKEIADELSGEIIWSEWAPHPSDSVWVSKPQDDIPAGSVFWSYTDDPAEGGWEDVPSERKAAA